MTHVHSLTPRRRTAQLADHLAFRALACLLLATLSLPADARQKPVELDPLELARTAYNDKRFAEAISLATDAGRTSAKAAAAAVVLARAHLEQFRLAADHSDLVAAREALRGVSVGMLTQPRDRVELLIALGETLYVDDEHSLDDRFSAAAEQFEMALGQADLLDETNRDALFDWWAGALDRQAQQGPESERVAIYRRILTRAESELARPEPAAAAAYWLAAAARGADDLPRAAGAAMAGWIRAGSLGARGLSLRQDLDRLMRQVILPERAKALASDDDPRPTLDLLEAQWAQVKTKWTEPAPSTP